MKFKYLLLLFCCIGGLITSCKENKKTQPTITVTILPQKFLVEQIAGDFLQVNIMVPPGMSPATCDMNISQLQKLHDSDLCFTIGHLPFEQTHLYPVLQQNPKIQVITHSEGVQLQHGDCGCSHAHDETHDHGGIDPHIWLSPKIFHNMATQVYRTLIDKYPAQQQIFQQNYNKLISAIDTLMLKAKEVFKLTSHYPFLIYHPALTYFASDYGLEQIAIEHEGKEPNPTHLKSIIDFAKEKKIQLIFIQKQFDVQNAQAIAKEINGRIVLIDPLAENWIEEVNKLIELFRTELQQN